MESHHFCIGLESSELSCGKVLLKNIKHYFLSPLTSYVFYTPIHLPTSLHPGKLYSIRCLMSVALPSPHPTLLSLHTTSNYLPLLSPVFGPDRVTSTHLASEEQQTNPTLPFPCIGYGGASGTAWRYPNFTSVHSQNLRKMHLNILESFSFCVDWLGGYFVLDFDHLFPYYFFNSE